MRAGKKTKDRNEARNLGKAKGREQCPGKRDRPFPGLKHPSSRSHERTILGKQLLPELAPSIERSLANGLAEAQFRAKLQDHDHDEGGIDLAAQESKRGWGDPVPAAFVPAAEAEPPFLRLAQPPWLSGVVSRVELPATARAGLRFGFLEEFKIKLAKLLEK